VKKRSWLFSIAIAGVFLLTSCFAGASSTPITFLEAKERAQEIDEYWDRSDSETPNRSVFNYTTSGLTGPDDERVVEKIEKYDSSAKYYYAEATTTSSNKTEVQEYWVYYEASDNKTYLAFNDGEDKSYTIKDGDLFNEEIKKNRLIVYISHKNLYLGGSFKEEDAEGVYKSKGEGSLYAKFKTTMYDSTTHYEIDVDNYLIHKAIFVDEGSDYESSIIGSYKSFALTKPNLSGYRLES
jgi:hypothetical protein